MYPPGASATISQASRCRKHPALCDHSSTSVLVSAVSGGWQAQLSGLRDAGTTVREAPEGAWSVLRERGSSR